MLAAPVTAAPEPWRPVFAPYVPVGGLTGIGFATHPASGRDLVLTVSHAGRGLFDAVTGERIARDRDSDEDVETTADGVLSCRGLGPVEGVRVPVAGLYGGGLHRTAGDGWTVEVVAPDWPHHRVLLCCDGGMPHRNAHGEGWWHVFHASWSELRAAGFSQSGQTFAVATSSDLSLWTRQPSVSAASA
ncbi:hypothetical protein [Streptomyces mashuensis]|nr:hypothetical protein [Streptomyces mashuensis]